MLLIARSVGGPAEDAIHNYHGVHKHLPPRCLTDRTGNPLLGWRVTLLPYLEQKALCDSMNFAEAWNSESNKKLSETVIPNFSAGVDLSEEPGMTRLRAPVFPGSMWHGDGPPHRFRDVTDGTSNTIAVIHAPPSDATPWASPDAWIISEDDPIADVFGESDQVIAVLLDGSSRTLERSEMDNAKLKSVAND